MQGQVFVKTIICNNLEGRPETYKPVAPEESGWNELGINVCRLFLPFIARYKKEIYASKIQFENKEKGNKSVWGLVVLEKVTAARSQITGNKTEKAFK